MSRPLRAGAAVLVAGLLGASAGSSTASASVRSISKPTYITKADAICGATQTQLMAAVAKLGAQPSDQQVRTYLVAVYVPSIQRVIAKIRKLGYPAGDKAKLTAVYNEAEAVLTKIKKNPETAINAGTSPFADVSAKEQAYGFKSCGASKPSSNASATAAAQALVGHYQGTWMNTTFGSTGTVDLVVALDAAGTNVSVTTMLTGNVFGAAAPAPETVTMPLAGLASGQPVTVTSQLFGTMTITAPSDGSLVADAKDVPGGRVTTFHLVLHPAAGELDGSYSAGLSDGSTANGTVTLHKT